MRILLNLGGIYTTFDGFQLLINLYYKLLYNSDLRCEIDMSKVNWIDANMCAPLGALIQSCFIQNPKARGISLLDMNDDVNIILRKNGFLSDMSSQCHRQPDIYQTTIEYCRFDCCDSSLFKEYVENHFIKRHIIEHIPRMDPNLQKYFRRSLFEIFENAAYHSQTEIGVFACGQYFPTKEILKFTIADLGIGIQQNISRHLKINYSPERAISWALDSMNTTRKLSEGTPGGLGLKLIKKFIYDNGGQMLIVSDRGYLGLKNGKEDLRLFNLPFPGTVVSISINTSRQSSQLSEREIRPDEVF